MNCGWPGFRGAVVTKFSYPFTIPAPEIVIYLWNVLISQTAFLLLFTSLDRLKDVLLRVQSPQWHQLARLSHGAGALRKESLSCLWERHKWHGCGEYSTDCWICRCPKILNTSCSFGLVLMRSQSEGLEKFGCGGGRVCVWCCECGTSASPGDGECKWHMSDESGLALRAP